MKENHELKKSDDYSNECCTNFFRKFEKIRECCNNFFRKFEKTNDEKDKELKNFIQIKRNLNDDISAISNNFYKINNFDEFLDLNEDIVDINNKYFDERYSCSYIAFNIMFFGILYSGIHLNGVQEMIIILNSMLNESIDELKLAITKTPREYNFYEVIKICSYQEIPDIDIAMVTSFLGILVSKYLGFITTNIIFQLIPGLLFLLFFYLFPFHTGKELEKNYSFSEILILLLTYILTSIMVGASSAISLKEINEVIQIYNKYTLYFYVNNNNNKEDEKEEDEKEDNQNNIDDKKRLSLAQDIIADFSFAFQSCISLLLTVFLNKMLIYILKDNLNQKKLLYGIAGISIAANILSSCLFIVYSRPIKINIEEKNNEEEKEESYKEEHNSNIEELFLLSNNLININKKLIDKSIQTNGNEETNIKKMIY